MTHERYAKIIDAEIEAAHDDGVGTVDMAIVYGAALISAALLRIADAIDQHS